MRWDWMPWKLMTDTYLYCAHSSEQQTWDYNERTLGLCRGSTTPMNTLDMGFAYLGLPTTSPAHTPMSACFGPG